MKLHLPQSRRFWIRITAPLVLAVLASFAWFWLSGLSPNPFPILRSPWQAQPAAVSDTTITVTPTATATGTAPPTETSTVTGTPDPLTLSTLVSSADGLRKEGLMIVAMRDGYNIHLFAYHPIFLPLTRLTNYPWDDLSPALSPDGSRVAFTSRQNGYWDLFILDLQTGRQTRVTDTPDYEGSPTWSPDGLWLAYERFNGNDLDVYILPLDNPKDGAIRLTDFPGADRSPAWSPQGRQIAFVSDQTGDEDVWIADLDRVDNRFKNISHDALSADRLPAWTPSGDRLAWASEKSGDRRLAVVNSGTDQPILLNAGDRPVWSPDGSILFAEVRGPNQQDLTAYQSGSGRIVMPLTPLPGAVYGMTWVRGPLPAWLEDQAINGDRGPSPALAQTTATRLPAAIAGRMRVLPLEDVAAPQARLHEAVIDSFAALRSGVSIETGWDALSSLEDAFVPVTTPNDPSLEDQWLYTGRAFALNPLLVSAGWMVIVPEDFGGQLYWRIYLKARYQDGSMGLPVSDMAWDLNARYAGSPRDFERGGKQIAPPTGYWIDLTELAGRYGWERMPSLTGWRTYYPAIRYNQFVITGGLSWGAAMNDIYPPEALATTTPRSPVTATVSLTPATPYPTATVTPTLTTIPTRRPTWTPMPNNP